MYRHSFIILFLSLLQIIYALPAPGTAQLIRIPSDSQRRPYRPRQGNLTNFCINNAENRQCWGGGYNIDTNVETTWPNTRRVVSYNLEVRNETRNIDGFPRLVYTINGQYPGPTIRANWGDTLRITVKNSLQNNGTSMHWHGVRQWKSNPMDGTNGITECPLAPGESRTYTFLATQYGTSWYHSHHSSQYSDGVVGTIQIDGPATANYAKDLGVMPLTDWFHTPAGALISLLSKGLIRNAPIADTILINGTDAKNGNRTGAYHRNTIEQGGTYRLRLINTGTFDNYKVGLDGHKMTVISSDFVPVTPFDVDWLFIGIGQRYDVIIKANQPISSYWFHVVPQAGCSANQVSNGIAIFTYKGANSTTPSNSTRNNAPAPSCEDPNLDLVPWVPLNVPSNETIPASSILDVGFAIVRNSSSQTQTLVQWTLNTKAMQAPWDKPTIEYVREGNTSYPPNMNLINLPGKNQWSFWVIQALPTTGTPPAQPHPMHLHGHDFYVLGAGTGNYSDATTLNYINPPRRDVAILPANGYLVLAFVTDNPGAWLMHCHVAWHIDLGLGAQFLERASEITPLLNQAEGWNTQCSKWDQYDDTAIYKEEGSGL